MADQDVAVPRRRMFRVTAFRVGFAAGLAAWALIYVVVHPYRAPKFNVEIVSSGLDVSRHGGRRLVVDHGHGSLSQMCNGACDDLWYRASDDENDYVVQVLDAKGACIVCDQPRGIMGGYGGWSHRWSISGAEALKISVSDQIAGTPSRPAGEVRSR
jgi:hypothetical protein